MHTHCTIYKQKHMCGDELNTQQHTHSTFLFSLSLCLSNTVAVATVNFSECRHFRVNCNYLKHLYFKRSFPVISLKKATCMQMYALTLSIISPNMTGTTTVQMNKYRQFELYTLNVC